MSKFISSIFALLFVVTLSQSAFADNKCGKMKSHKEKMTKVYSKLALTNEQKQQIKTIKQQYKEQRKALYMKHKNLRTQMRGVVQSEPLDQAQLDALIKDKQSMVAERVKMRVAMKRAINKVLTPEQKQKMQLMRKKWAN